LRAGHLALASCTRFSPNTAWPAAITGAITSTSKVLDTAIKVTDAGSRPASRQACAISAFTPARAEAGEWVDGVAGVTASSAYGLVQKRDFGRAAHRTITCADAALRTLQTANSNDFAKPLFRGGRYCLAEGHGVSHVFPPPDERISFRTT